VAGPEPAADGTAAAQVRIADRAWLLVVHDPNDPGPALPLLIAVFGVLLATLFGALVLIWSRGERMRELKRQASQDSLTGLKNRRRFEEDLRAELARSHRYGQPGALLMLDVDRFKRVNDTLGHASGDRVLADIAEILRTRARETDAIARIGGDEFAIVLPSCDARQARIVADSISAAIRERAAAEDGLPPITASIGIAPFGAGQRLSFESVLSRADTAMYAAKASGRDSVQVFDLEGAEEAGAAG
jgi:diguanylate cyclase (GGDEF)-like protein